MDTLGSTGQIRIVFRMVAIPDQVRGKFLVFRNPYEKQQFLATTALGQTSGHPAGLALKSIGQVGQSLINSATSAFIKTGCGIQILLKHAS